MNRSINPALLPTLVLMLFSWSGAQAATSAQIGDPTGYGFGGHHMEHNLVLPQIALGSHYTTRVLLLNMGNAQRMPWATDQALVNTSDRTVTVNLDLRGPDGASATHADRTLQPGEQIVEFADELFEGQVPEGFQGSIEVSADGEDVVVLGLLMSDDVLTSIPTRHYGQWQNGDGHMGGGMRQAGR